MQQETVALWDHHVQSGLAQLQTAFARPMDKLGFPYPRVTPFKPTFENPEPTLNLEIVAEEPRFRYENISDYRARITKAFKAQLDAHLTPIKARLTRPDGHLMQRAQIAVLMQQGKTLGEVAMAVYRATDRKTMNETKQDYRRFSDAIGLKRRPSRTQKGFKTSPLS